MKKNSFLANLILLAVIITLFTSCVFSKSVGFRAKPGPEEDRAQVIIERQDNTRREIAVELNGVIIGSIKNMGKHYFIVQREGTHTLRIGIFGANGRTLWFSSEPIRFTVNNSNLGEKHIFTTTIDNSRITRSSVIPLEYNTETHVQKIGGIDGAIGRAIKGLTNDLPTGSRVAVINISSDNRSLSAHALDEIEYLLVSARKFTVVDRVTLDRIRSEQNFQMSGEVSDTSAVSIGQMLGANVVLTGSITELESTRRINLRLLDVRTSQIITIIRTM